MSVCALEWRSTARFNLIDLICISHSERIMCRKFTYWQDLASAASFVNTQLACLKVLPTLVALSSPEMSNVCSLGKWSESGGAVLSIRLHIREANAMGTYIILAAISKGVIEALGLGAEARADTVEGEYHGQGGFVSFQPKAYFLDTTEGFL